MTDKPRVFGYARASTKHQVESPDTQKEIIKKYAEFHSLGVPTYYVDSAKSGKTPISERTAGAALLKAIRRGDHVVVSKLDRAFRNLKDCVTVLETFERMGVSIHVCNLMGGAIDLSQPMGKFIVHVLAAFAELERAFISERTKDGLSRKKRSGKAHTRYPGYGNKWVKKWIDGVYTKVPVRDDEEREAMRSIVDWRMNHSMSWDQIRQHLAYVLKLKTKEGKEWDCNRVKRAFRAELALQAQEQRGSR